MRVTFTRTDARRYVVGIERRATPALLPRHAPGYDDLSARWAGLSHGESLVLEWPDQGLNLAGSQRGRRHRVVG